jgi:hypothetical protein
MRTASNEHLVLLGLGLAAYGAIVIYADPLLLAILVYAATLWIATPCIGVALVIFLFAAVSRRWLRPPLLLLSMIFAIACLMWLTLPINLFIQRRAVAAAQAYPDRIAPLLEQYREQHGMYPNTLDQLSSRLRVPRLLRRSYGYHSDGQHYTFTFPEPGGMIDVWDYSSETRTWHLST